MASDLVENERTKLIANAFDRASTACLTLGFLAPIAAATYSVTPVGPSAATFLIGALSWIFAAAALHLFAQIILGGLTT